MKRAQSFIFHDSTTTVAAKRLVRFSPPDFEILPPFEIFPPRLPAIPIQKFLTGAHQIKFRDALTMKFFTHFYTPYSSLPPLRGLVIIYMMDDITPPPDSHYASYEEAYRDRT